MSLKWRSIKFQLRDLNGISIIKRSDGIIILKSEDNREEIEGCPIIKENKY